MKHVYSICLLLFTGSPFATMAQPTVSHDARDYVKGFVIWNNGDTLKGRIDNHNLSDKIRVISGNQEKQKIKTKDIIEYTRGGDLYRKFDNKIRFLKREKKGRIEYYATVIVSDEMTRTIMYLVKDGQYYDISGGRFKKIMTPLLADYEGNDERIREMRFHREEIPELIQLYNLSQRAIPNAKK